MPSPPVRERRVTVLLGTARDVRDLEGPPAELIALVAAAGLSARTVALLRAIALEEGRLALIETGSLTADLAPGQLRLHLHQSRPRLEVQGR